MVADLKKEVATTTAAEFDPSAGRMKKREYDLFVCRKTDIDVNFNCCVLVVSASYLPA